MVNDAMSPVVRLGRGLMMRGDDDAVEDEEVGCEDVLALRKPEGIGSSVVRSNDRTCVA
jgi:hypothetical protein